MNAHSLTIEQAEDHYRAVISSAHSTSEERIAATQALRAAKIAAETTAERAARLEREARDLDAEAERHMKAASDAASRAAGRRLRGNDDEYARSFDREELACTKCAADAMAEAQRLGSQAASLRRAQAYAADVVASLEAAE